MLQHVGFVKFLCFLLWLLVDLYNVTYEIIFMKWLQHSNNSKHLTQTHGLGHLLQCGSVLHWFWELNTHSKLFKCTTAPVPFTVPIPTSLILSTSHNVQEKQSIREMYVCSHVCSHICSYCSTFLLVTCSGKWLEVDSSQTMGVFI